MLFFAKIFIFGFTCHGKMFFMSQQGSTDKNHISLSASSGPQTWSRLHWTQKVICNDRKTDKNVPSSFTQLKNQRLLQTADKFPTKCISFITFIQTNDLRISLLGPKTSAERTSSTEHEVETASKRSTNTCQQTRFNRLFTLTKYGSTMCLRVGFQHGVP